jgi:hypothetical protein
MPSAYQPAAPVAPGVPAPSNFPPQPAEMDTIVLPEATVKYASLNMEHSLVLSQGIPAENVNLALFPENMRPAVTKNIQQLLPGEGDDEESGLETLERKRLNYLKCVKADAQGTKGDFKIVDIETGDMTSLRGRNETDVFIVAVQKYRQYRTDKEDPNSTICSSFHTGAKERQIPTIFYDPHLSRGRVQSCAWCPLAPNNPTHPRNRRCQTQFVFYVVCRDDMTQVLRVFEPMKNYDGKQQKALDRLYAQCNNGMAIGGQTHWIHFRGQEFKIPKSDFTTAVIVPGKGDPVSDQEAAIINMWRDAVAIPFSEGEKSLQFLKVKSFLQNPENYDNSQAQANPFGSGNIF